MYHFRKEERLCSKRDIEILFNQGKSFRIGNFRVVWRLVPDTQAFYARVLFSVGRRNIRHAVERNKVKRRLREAYRLNKSELIHYLSSHNIYLHFACIYNGTEVPSFQEVEHKIILILHRLILINEESSG